MRLRDLPARSHAEPVLRIARLVEALPCKRIRPRIERRIPELHIHHSADQRLLPSAAAIAKGRAILPHLPHAFAHGRHALGIEAAAHRHSLIRRVLRIRHRRAHRRSLPDRHRAAATHLRLAVSIPSEWIAALLDIAAHIMPRSIIRPENPPGASSVPGLRRP